MTFTLVFGIGLLAVGVWRLVVLVGRPAIARPRWLSYLQGGTGVGAWLSAGGWLLFTPTTRQMPVAFICMVVLLGAVVLLGGISLLRRSMTAAGDANLRSFVARRCLSTWARAAHAARIVAPNGFREVGFSSEPLERLLAPLAMVRVYLLVLALVPVLVAMVFVAVLNTGPALQREAMGALVGYNALALLSCLTTVMIGTTIAMAVLTYSGALRFRIDLKGAVRTIAICTGNGTAIGVVAAALLPVMSRVFPSVFAPTADFAGLTPQILVDLPAAMAVLGYAFGLIRAAVELASPAENLLLRRFVAPAIFLMVLGVMVNTGFGPRSLLLSMLSGATTASEIGCTEGAFRSHSDDSGWIVQAMQQCGGAPVHVDDQTFAVISLMALGATAIAVLITDFRVSRQAAEQGRAAIRA